MDFKRYRLPVAMFGLIYVLNLFTPLLSDDYFLAFVWPDGFTINGLPENVKRIENIFDVFESLSSYYFNWGGRLFGQGLMTFFIWQGKEVFNIFNSFIVVILVLEIYWLSHEGKITFKFDEVDIFWIFFALWSFNISFIDTFLWLSGACNYLWITVILLVFLLPYVRNYYDASIFRENKLSYDVGMFLTGLVAGCSFETVICWIIFFQCLYLFNCKKMNSLQGWKVAGFLGLCSGFSILIFAPGNSARLKTLELTGISIQSYADLLSYKLPELTLIIFFHIFLWYFIFNFFFRYCNKLDRQVIIRPYLNIIKLSTLLALCSGVMMFFIPSSGKRVSFISLCFLLIAVATIFRIQEKFKVFITDIKALSFIKKVASFFFIVTVVVSLISNFNNWRHWKNALVQLKGGSEDTVAYITKSSSERSDLWLFGSGMIHLIPFPVSDDENDAINLMISKYYGIKGIKIIKR